MTIKRDEKGQVDFGRLEFLFQWLIILSLVCFTLSTDKTLAANHQSLFNSLEGFFIYFFTVEYVLRIALSRPRRAYAFSFMGVVDLLAILPFYLTTGLNLTSMRSIRLLRLFRLLKLCRYSKAMTRYHRALVDIKEELILFGTSSIILLFLTAVGIYYCEKEAQPDAFGSILDSLWWAVCTLTTVGYGDVYPVTPLGRVFTVLILAIGLGIVAVPAGLFATALSKATRNE